MLLLHGNILSLSTPINLSAYNKNFQVDSFFSFFQNIHCHGDDSLEKLSVQTLKIKHGHSDPLFNVFIGANFLFSLLETACIPVTARSMHNFFMLNCSSSHCHSVSCASDANSVCKSIFLKTYAKI
jgi:hypothetical protein